jgi:hypothetical protein
MMKYLISLSACVSLLFSCVDGEDKGAIDPVSNPVSKPYIGGVTLSWKNPAQEDYYCTLVSYTDAAGETVKKKISHYEAAGGVTTTTITGFEDTKTYTFTLTAYNTRGATSTPVTIEGTPHDASMAYLYIVNTVTSTPGFQGATLNWTNEYGVPVSINISYTDAGGTPIVKKLDASVSGGTHLGGITSQTAVTVTTENPKGDLSEAVVCQVSPASTKGELPQGEMSIAAISSQWHNPGWEGEKMLDGDVNSYWYSQDAGGLWPHWFTVDLGGAYMVDWVEMVRSPYENGLGSPDRVQLQSSVDGETFTDLGTYDFDAQYVYGHTFNFKEVYARYIKVICLSGPATWTHFAEFLAYNGSANKYAAEAAAERMPPEADPDDTDELFEEEFEYFLLGPGGTNNMDLTQSGDNKYEFRVVTTGGDPFVPVNPFARKAVGPMLVFRYKATAGFTGEFFWCNAGGGAAGGRSTTFDVPENNTGEWKTFKVNLAGAMAQHNWAGNAGDFVRFDFGNMSDVTIDIKNIHFRALRESEL